MAFIRKVKTGSGATAVQIAHKNCGKITKIIHFGSAHTEEELEALLFLARQELVGSQQSLFDPISPTMRIGIKKTFSTLLFRILKDQYTRLGFDKLNDEDFANLCIARIVEPVSKLDSIRILEDLGVSKLSKNRLYRCLARIIKGDYRQKIADVCFRYADKKTISLVLYDVTTLYFEVQKEDNYRKPGLSKERRLEPQIVVGLLVDQDGFPLALHSFEGNTAETKTILPVIEQFKAQHQLTNVTVVADAGMLSAKNLQVLADAGYSYIVGSRLQKIPYDIAIYQKTKNMTDHQIITTHLDNRRIIYQYRTKRALLDMRNIEKQIAKAENILSGRAVAKKAKFLTVKTKEKKLNQPLIDKVKALAGIKGYVTNLNITDEKIIDFYHKLWKVEASFRMSKSDLRARPIFHHKRDSIEAHLTVVFTALAISKRIEDLTGVSIKLFLKNLRPIRSGLVSINGRDYEAEAEIPSPAESILSKLRSGH